MKIIKPVNRKDFEIIVDDEDYQRVMDFATNGWEVRYFTKSNNPYATTRKTIDGKRKQFYLHRLVMNALNSNLPHVDHINRKTLDNRKENLRFVTRSQNMKNRASKKTSRCKYLGVSYCLSHVGSDKYRVNIQSQDIAKKNIHLGYYSDAKAAAYAYNQGAMILHGEYANLNEVGPTEIYNSDEIKIDVVRRINEFIERNRKS